jgi:hypothetical protein
MKNGSSGRNFDDWLAAYVEYAGFSEAPAYMHFFTGVVTIAGALRRHVWIDMKNFKWYPNFFVVLVAEPGIVSKTTTMDFGMGLLRKVPDVHFGPSVVTWQALVKKFGESREAFEWPPGSTHFVMQSALTLAAGEFGNLVNPAERETIDLYVDLWDCRTGVLEKLTKTAGVDKVENPYLNMIACTTPAWIAGTFPEYVIGGGFVSRCLFVYAEKKAKLVAYPSLYAPPDFEERGQRLVEDLTHISTLIGAYELADDALAWGTEWYEFLWSNKPAELADERFKTYLARKQSHIHKLAMVLAVAVSDELVLHKEHLFMANKMISDLELEMPKVFAKIGRTEASVQAERFIKFVQKHGTISYAAAYQYVHSAFPGFRNFEDVVAGAQRAGYMRLEGDKLIAIEPKNS